MSAPLETPATPPPLLPPDMHPSVEHIITEDNAPVDNIYSERQMRLLTDPLYASWRGGTEQRSFLALANVGMYFSLNTPPLVPDVLFSLDVKPPPNVWEKRHRCYLFWEYGKEPDVVFEIVSNTEGGELTTKLKQYAQIHIPYYVVWDPEGHLSDQKLRIYGDPSRKKYKLLSDQSFADFGLGLTVWHGTFEDYEADWLRWCDRDGQMLQTGAERADLEKSRADTLELRAKRLEEQLRKLGAEPLNGKP